MKLMSLIIDEKENIIEHSYMGKNEGDLIKIGEFSRRKLPKPILMNVLKSVSKKLESDVSQSKLKSGEYDNVEIKLFGQLLAFLTDRY